MQGSGWDLTVNTKNIEGVVKWYSCLLVSVTKDQVSHYKVTPANISYYLNPGLLNPIIGKPVYSVFGFRYAGLDTAGNPMALLAGKASENYGALVSSTQLSDNLVYNRARLPRWYFSVLP